MLQSKPILKFFFVFFITYGILLAVYPLFRETTGTYLINFGNKFLHSPIKNSYVLYEKTQEKFDVKVSIGNVTQVKNERITLFNGKILSYEFVYIPCALLIAFILASPVTKKRKLQSLAISLVLLHLLLLFRMYIQIRHVCIIQPSLNLEVSSLIYKNTIESINHFLNSGSRVLFIVVFIWLSVTFRKEDLLLFRSENKN